MRRRLVGCRLGWCRGQHLPTRRNTLSCSTLQTHLPQLPSSAALSLWEQLLLCQSPQDGVVVPAVGPHTGLRDGRSGVGGGAWPPAPGSCLIGVGTSPWATANWGGLRTSLVDMPAYTQVATADDGPARGSHLSTPRASHLHARDLERVASVGPHARPDGTGTPSSPHAGPPVGAAATRGLLRAAVPILHRCC